MYNNVEQIKSAVRISDVVGARIKLGKRIGSKYSALCPFHSEKTPSFFVDDGTGFFHCFGCGASGDVIAFVEKYDHISFRDALEKLASMCGLQLESKTEINREKNSNLYMLLEKVCSFFENNLNRDVISYLNLRGLSAEFIKKFRIGFSPDYGLRGCFYGESVTKTDLISAGLLSNRGFEYFRSRIMFPIFDARGRVIGFGGRSMLKRDKLKYINSPECSLFKKSFSLYGINFARKAIAEKRHIIIVEGYSDVISMHMHGFANTVACLGTAITKEQIKMLFSISKDIVFCFDGDDAGNNAACRVSDLVLSELKPEFTVRFAKLPFGKDPCDLLSSGQVDVVVQAFDSAMQHYEALYELEFKKHTISCIKDIMAFESILFQKLQGNINTSVAINYRAFFKSRLFTLRGDVLFSNKKSNKNANLLQNNSLKNAPETDNLTSSVYMSEYNFMQCILTAVICKCPSLVTEEYLTTIKNIKLRNSICRRVIAGMVNCKKLQELSFEEVKEYLESNQLMKDFLEIEKELEDRYYFASSGLKNDESTRSLFQLSLVSCRLFVVREKIKAIKCNILQNMDSKELDDLSSIVENLGKLELQEESLCKKKSHLMNVIGDFK